MVVKSVMIYLSLIVVFILLNIAGLYFGDDPCQDVDGKWSGFTEEELMEGYLYERMIQESSYRHK